MSWHMLFDYVWFRKPMEYPLLRIQWSILIHEMMHPQHESDAEPVWYRTHQPPMVSSSKWCPKWQQIPEPKKAPQSSKVFQPRGPGPRPRQRLCLGASTESGSDHRQCCANRWMPWRTLGHRKTAVWAAHPRDYELAYNLVKAITCNNRVMLGLKKLDGTSFSYFEAQQLVAFGRWCKLSTIPVTSDGQFFSSRRHWKGGFHWI